MKVLHISASDNKGGAAKAALRNCEAQRSLGIDAHMYVLNKTTDLFFVHGIASGRRKFFFTLKNIIAQKILDYFKHKNAGYSSLNFFNSPLLKIINKSDADIVNLHWTGDEIISVADIAKIKKPIVWTLHDMWAFGGTEHYPENNDHENGYSSKQKGFDINKWNWLRKNKAWKKIKFNIIAPCEWMYVSVKESILFKSQNVYKIQYPLNLQVFKPADQKMARKILNLPLDKKLILFGAEGGDKDLRKGFDLLEKALIELSKGYDLNIAELVIFGMSAPQIPVQSNFKVNYAGLIHDESTLALLYSSADVMVVPSRMDNLPQTAIESIACGTPVVAFDIGGLPDIIEHKVTGYLAIPKNEKDLSTGIYWILSQNTCFRKACRDAAIQKYNYKTVVEQYIKVYNKALV